MSLLNQVLLDLEKNTKKKPAYKLLSHVKAVSQKKHPTYLFISFFIVAILIANLFYLFKEKIFSTYIPSMVEKPLQTKIQPKLTQAIQKITPTELPPPLPLPIISVKKETRVKPLKAPVIVAVPSTPTIKIIKTTPKRIKKEPKLYQSIKKDNAIQLFEQAKKEVNIVKKKLLFNQILKLNPQNIDARLLLSKSLLQNGLTSEAAMILDKGLIITPKQLQLITMRSQISLQKKQPEKALETLLLIDTHYIKDEMYLSLLAAAYQQNNDSLNSLQTYEKLLKEHPHKAEYWLGLAIGHEQQKQTPQALQAYHQALSKKSLKIGIVDYIKDRIRILKHL